MPAQVAAATVPAPTKPPGSHAGAGAPDGAGNLFAMLVGMVGGQEPGRAQAGQAPRAKAAEESSTPDAAAAAPLKEEPQAESAEAGADVQPGVEAAVAAGLVIPETVTTAPAAAETPAPSDPAGLAKPEPAAVPPASSAAIPAGEGVKPVDPDIDAGVGPEPAAADASAEPQPASTSPASKPVVANAPSPAPPSARPAEAEAPPPYADRPAAPQTAAPSKVPEPQPSPPPPREAVAAAPAPAPTPPAPQAERAAAMETAAPVAAAAAPAQPNPATQTAPKPVGGGKAAPVDARGRAGAAETPRAEPSAGAVAAAGPEPGAPGEDEFALDADLAGFQADGGEPAGNSDPDAPQPALAGPQAASGGSAQAPGAPGAAGTVAHLAAQIVRRLDGRATRFEIQLDPAGLGAVKVSVHIDARGRLSAAMAFDRPESAEALKARAGDLRQALEQAGFDLSGGGLSFEADLDGGLGRQAWEQADTGARGRGRAFDAAAHTAELADQAAIQAPVRAGGLRGLDIRI